MLGHKKSLLLTTSGKGGNLVLGSDVFIDNPSNPKLIAKLQVRNMRVTVDNQKATMQMELYRHDQPVESYNSSIVAPVKPIHDVNTISPEEWWDVSILKGTGNIKIHAKWLGPGEPDFQALYQKLTREDVPQSVALRAVNNIRSLNLKDNLSEWVIKTNTIQLSDAVIRTITKGRINYLTSIPRE